MLKVACAFLQVIKKFLKDVKREGKPKLFGFLLS